MFGISSQLDACEGVRVLGVRVLGVRVLGVRVLGVRVLGVRVFVVPTPGVDRQTAVLDIPESQLNMCVLARYQLFIVCISQVSVAHCVY